MPVPGGTVVSTVDVLQAQIEKVRNKLQVYFETTDQISGLIGKGAEVETISRKLYRIPVMLYRGGVYQKFNADGGDMGGGSGMKVEKLTAGYIYSDYVVEVSLETMDTTSKPGQAIVNVFAKQLSEAMTEIKCYDDIAFHGDGTGFLTDPSTAIVAGPPAVLTFAGATDFDSVNKLRPGMAVSVWSSSGVAKRTTVPATAIIEQVDYSNRTVTLNGTVTGMLSGDRLAFANIVDSANAASFSPTWPGTPGTSGPLSGDTFRHGMYYANDADITHYYLGQLKSAMPQLLPSRVNAATSGIVFPHGLLMLDQIIQKRDPDVTRGMIGVAHMSQRAAVHALGVVLSQWERRGANERSRDLQPTNIGYEDTFDFCGIKCHLSKRQKKNRMDFLVPKVWGRAQLYDTKFHEVSGKSIFESRAQATANLRAAQHFLILQAYDFVCFDPGCQGYIDNLTLPTGY
jgi:hypothetical protein